MSRTKNVSKNLYTSTICYVVNIIMSFVLRTVFIAVLDKEYLGVNGLFVNILSFLSLSELGVGTAIIYSLYKPLADGDKELVKVYMNIFKKVYRIIGVFVAVVGVCLIPFLPYLIAGESNVDNLVLIYVLFVLNSASSYFFSYNQSLLNADQKIYVVKVRTEIFRVASQILQMVFLLLTKDYLVYLGISIVFTVLTNVALYFKAVKLYPYLKEKNIQKLEPEQKTKLIDNIKAIFLHRIGAILVLNVDNIVMSAFLGLAVVGMYSNYTLIITAVTGVILVIDGSIRASVGNYVAKESLEDSYKMFKLNDFIWFGVYLFCAVCLVNLLNPFIEDLWIRDSSFLFGGWEVLVLVLNFYIQGLRKNVLIYKESFGVFAPDRYKPIVEGVLNLILSIVLANYIGFSGILLATIITNVCTCFTIEPFVLFKHGLKCSPKEYYFGLAYKLLVSAIIIYTSIYLCNLVTGHGILDLILRGIICVAVFGVGIIVFYFKSEQLKKCKSLAFKIIKR